MGDRLSELPDEILHQILSLLRFDQQVRTCVLSSRWRRLWSTNPVLRLDRLPVADRELAFDGLVSIVDHCLLSCSRLEKLQSLFLPVSSRPALASALPRWLRFAADRSVDELVLRPVSCGMHFFPLAPVPPVLFDCRYLAVLKMESCFVRSVPSTAARRYHSLKTLVLRNVYISNEALHALLSRCPSIEHLTVVCCDEVNDVVIVSPTMKSLSIYSCGWGCRLNIVSAPQLRSLVFSGDILKVGSLDEAPDLEEATLLFHDSRPFGDFREWQKFLSSIRRIKVLSVNWRFFQFSLDDDCDIGNWRAVLENLRELHWWPVLWTGDETFTTASLRALISNLRDFPFLKLLCVHCHLDWENDFEEDDDFCTDPLQEYEGVGYVLPQLKMLEVIGFSGTTVETRMVEFLLDKAVALESLVINYAPGIAGQLSWIGTPISEMPVASPLFRVALLRLPDDPCPKDDTVLRYQCLDPSS